jgi:hypothetical protein
MSDLSDRIASELQKEGTAVVGGEQLGRPLESAEFTVGELFDAVSVLGLEDPRAVTIRGGRWDGGVEVVLP